MDALPGFLIAASALAGSPGPATLRLAAAGAALTRFFRDLRSIRLIDLVFSSAFVGSVALVFFV